VKQLSVRLDRVKAALPEPPPPLPPLDPSRLTAAQLVRMAELQERWQAVGIAGLTSDELEEIIALREVLRASGPEEA
jgi:hypothetical protein